LDRSSSDLPKDDDDDAAPRIHRPRGFHSRVTPHLTALAVPRSRRVRRRCQARGLSLGAGERPCLEARTRRVLHGDVQRREDARSGHRRRRVQGTPILFSFHGPCTAPVGKGRAYVKSRWIPLKSLYRGYHTIEIVQRMDGRVVYSSSPRFFIEGTAQVRKPTVTITSGPKGSSAGRPPVSSSRARTSPGSRAASTTGSGGSAAPAGRCMRTSPRDRTPSPLVRTRSTTGRSSTTSGPSSCPRRLPGSARSSQSISTPRAPKPKYVS